MKINIYKERKNPNIILLMTVYLGMLLSCSNSLAVSDPNKQIIKNSNSKSVSEEKNAKYWAERIQKVRGDELMTLLRAVPRIRDPNLIQSILDYAIEDNYSTMYLEGLPGGPASPRYHSTFDEAAGLLYSITKGKIGLEKVTRQGPLPEEKRKALIVKWRQELPKVKQEFRTEILEKQKVINPIAHKELLDILAKAEDANNRNEFIKEFKSHKMNDKLETIAYVLQKGLYSSVTIISMVYNDEELHDKRLLPFIRQTIKESEGEALLSAVWTATIIPDKSILPDLMKVLDNNYVKEYKALPNNLIPRKSVFLYAAEAIYKITDGKIGNNLVGTNEENLYKEKDSLIKQWRKIYDETLKKDYEKN